MAKCPYCARPLRMGGLKCHACRRFVLRRVHVVFLVAVAVAVAVGLLELIAQLTPPPLKTH
jgi:hypothetical protein